MAAQEKIAVYNLADLKNTSDDAIPNYLNSLGFKQIHTLADTRLALGYGSLIVAAACFLWDYKLGFDSTKPYTAIAVCLYMLLNGAMTYWISFVEKGTIYQGISPNGEKMSLATWTRKNVPVYHLKVTVAPKKGKRSSLEVAKSFVDWFDHAGHFVANPFQVMLASSVPVIGQADPKRAAAAPQKPTGIFDVSFLGSLAAASGTDAVAGAEASAGKKVTRRKA